jgi:glycosyltransferase involved in cell wall biosynthesis
VDGNTQVIQDGQNGRLVPYGDANALARALIEAFTAPKARGWGRRGRDQIISQYALHNVVTQYLELYRSLAPQFAAIAAPDEGRAEYAVS